MYVVRSVNLQDAEAFEQCAALAGIGITNLPRETKQIRKQIRYSMRAGSKSITTPKDEDYLFVLADPNENSVKGTCGIYSRVGGRHPFFTLSIDSMEVSRSGLPEPLEKRILRPKRYPGSPSEICALYLLPEMRKGGYGKLLSLCRFLFIAAFPERFNDKVIANLRGFAEPDRSPFWEGVGKPFLPISFEEVIAMRAQDEHFISKIFPKYPIPVTLLPLDAREAIGKVHPNTVPALQMLLNEGFKVTSSIDPIDGGPIVEAEKSQIRSILRSKVATVKEITRSPIDSPSYIISNDQLDFRACYGNLRESNGVILNVEIANALNVTVGSTVRYLELEK